VAFVQRLAGVNGVTFAIIVFWVIGLKARALFFLNRSISCKTGESTILRLENGFKVDPKHQGKDLGRKIMEYLMSWLEQPAPNGAYVTLLTEVPEPYEKIGFNIVRPEKEGMALVWGSPK